MAEASEPQSAAQGAAALAANHAEQLRQTSADMENSFNFEADLTDEEKQENESWEHAEPKYVAIFAKGMLASIFIAVSMYITVAGASTMEPSYYVLKWLMTILCWLLTIPALYSTTLIVLTFFAVARDTVAKELGMKRPTYIVAIMGLVMLVVLPFTLPLIIVLGPILDQCEGTLPIRDFWLVVVGLIDFVQTLVLIPLGYVVIWASECPTDVFINIVVVQVFANLDDEFVRSFGSPLDAKLEVLGTYCEKAIKPEAKPEDN